MPKEITKKTPKRITKEIKIKVDLPEKVLGKSTYKNSKKKKKVQQKKVAEVKKVISKDRQLKVRIKHLEKELLRISKAVESGKIDDKKINDEKFVIEQKVAQLKDVLNAVFVAKKPKI